MATTTISFNPAGALFDSWFRIASLYQDVMRESMQQMLSSSTAIVQNQAQRAFTGASQASADALAKNALDVQQQFLQRWMEANQQAMTMMMGGPFAEAWMSALRPLISSTAANR